MGLDFYYIPGSAPCRAVLMTAKAVGVELNLKLTNLMAGDHLKPEFVAVSLHCLLFRHSLLSRATQIALNFNWCQKTAEKKLTHIKTVCQTNAQQVQICFPFMK